MTLCMWSKHTHKHAGRKRMNDERKREGEKKARGGGKIGGICMHGVRCFWWTLSCHVSEYKYYEIGHKLKDAEAWSFAHFFVLVKKEKCQSPRPCLFSADSSPCKLYAILIKWNHFLDSIPSVLSQFWDLPLLFFLLYQIQRDCFSFLPSVPFLSSCTFFLFLLKLANTSSFINV